VDCPSLIMKRHTLAMDSSGADKGFFQQCPELRNHFYDDTYQRCFTCESWCWEMVVNLVDLG
jgi:hypothetical protein